MINDGQGISGSAVITATDARRWIAKAQPLVRTLLELPGVPAAPASVVASEAASIADGPYGGFMLTWPEARHDEQVIHHLPNGEFFLTLLEWVYAPVLSERPHLRSVLGDRTRLEMSMTNDVLQVQLIEGPAAYSMIRHHALMLFEATLWVAPASRAKWVELYNAVADFVMADRTAAPSLAELADVEAAGFAVMQQCASRSVEAADVMELLSDPVLDSFVTYQLWATAALAALWRDYSSHSATAGTAWHARHLSEYQQPDFLIDRLSTWL